ncbi:MAG: MmcQ/YjbR family DNA-binding protein, partial [Gammaproteobacteria bacterium]
PFGPDVAVIKVKNKMFALLCVRKGVPQVNLKCDPDEAFMLRDLFPAVLPGYHMNKLHWNTVIFDKTIPKEEIMGMMEKSYRLVVKGLKKADRNPLMLRYADFFIDAVV